MQSRRFYQLAFFALLLVALLAVIFWQPWKSGVWRGIGGGTRQRVISAEELGTPQNEYMPVKGAPRQIILFYTGDTLSIPDANTSYTPPEGGVAALSQELLTYQRRIVQYNRERVESEVGDGTKITTDFENGLLGEHPYLLMDYGGWERINDPVGEIYVDVYAQFYDYFNFSAVGSKLYQEVSDEEWQKYRAAAPELKLLVSAGEHNANALESIEIVTRTAHGELWGIAAIPLPDVAGMAKEEAFPLIEKSFGEYVESAAAALATSGCKYSVLMAPGWGTAQYETIQDDPRFTVVIGAHPRVSAAEGYGDLHAGKPLLLPELTPRGRQLGVCHLYWPVAGSAPDMYYLTLRSVQDDQTQPYPYRTQVRDALIRHREQLMALPETDTIQPE